MPKNETLVLTPTLCHILSLMSFEIYRMLGNQIHHAVEFVAYFVAPRIKIYGRMKGISEAAYLSRLTVSFADKEQ